jgi:hypothetical protein
MELDANRAANAAMRVLSGDPGVSTPPARQLTTIGIQRAATASGGGTADAGAVVRDIGAGHPLDTASRTRMEKAFGASFGSVSIHDGPEASTMSRKLDAHAFTIGNHIAFARGAFRPGTSSGDELLAHELAHTIQQRSTAPMIARRGTAGGCAGIAEAVDEQRDENAAAGRLAHKQIQEHYGSKLYYEVSMPRGTKKQRKQDCPGPTVNNGRLDFFLNGKKRAQIGEIKSRDGADYAPRDVSHYIKRAGELSGRLTNGNPCAVESPVDGDDTRFDKKWFHGHIAKGSGPTFVPLDSVVPKTETSLGPFIGNPKKRLHCELREGGGVIYWCTDKKKKRRKQEKQKQVVAKPQEDQEVVEVKKPAKKRMQIVEVQEGFWRTARDLPDTYGLEGRDFVVAVDADLHDAIVKQFQHEQMEQKLRLMRVDPRRVPFIQVSAPLVGLLPFFAAIDIVLLGALIAPAIAAAAPVAATATAVEGAAVATTATYTTATGVTLTVIEGGGAAAAVVEGSTVVASVAKGSAAAAAVVAAILAQESDANADELIEPLLDKPLVTVADVTGSSAALGSSLTVDGHSFKVAIKLSTQD